MVPSRPPNLQKTEEKLKNPQELDTQALESQEGLKREEVLAAWTCVYVVHARISRRVETLLWRTHPRGCLYSPLESQEGLKLRRGHT